MNKIMYAIFRFFRKHRVLYYILMFSLFGLVAIGGLQLKFEEDISKLLPPTDDNSTLDLAFSDLKVKDKIFLQFRKTDNSVLDPDEMTSYCDLFMEQLLTKDSADGDIYSTLYDIDPMLMVELSDFLFANLPIFADTSIYEHIDSLLSDENLSRQLVADQELLERVDNDVIVSLVTTDPLGLRNLFVKADESGKIRQPLSSMNIIDGHLFNPDTTALIAYISPSHSSKDSKAAIRLIRKIDQCRTESQFADAGIEIFYHGTIVNSAHNSLRTKRDIALTMGVSFAIILLLLLIALRQPNNIVLLMMPLLFGTFFGMACMWLLVDTMSLMSMGVSAVVLGVAMSYCLHIIIHYKYTGDRELTIQQQTKPVILGSLTTVGSFAGLLFTNSALLNDLGLFACFALVGITFAALIFMPQHFPRNNKRNERIFKWMEKISAYPLDENKWFVGVVAVLVVVLICFAPKVEFDPNLKNINYVSPDTQLAQDLWNRSSHPGTKQQYYAALGSTLDEALVVQREFENKCEELKDQNLIDHFTPLSVLLPDNELQQQRIAAWKNYFETRADQVENIIRRNAAANDIDGDIYEPFFDLMHDDFEPISILEADIIPNSLIDNFTEKIGDQYLVFTPVVMPLENVGIVNDNLTAVENAIVLDPFYYATDLVKMIDEDFYVILLISSIFVFIVLLLAFKNWILAIIAFIPMGLSWYVVEGAMALTGQEFNLINIVVSSFIFGMGVDYSIFVMDGLLSAARGEDNNLLVYHKTAITMSAIILIICMASLLFAIHPAIHSIGFPSLIGMLTTLLLSYTIQPFLFKKFLKTSKGRSVILGDPNTKGACCK